MLFSLSTHTLSHIQPKPKSFIFFLLSLSLSLSLFPLPSSLFPHTRSHTKPKNQKNKPKNQIHIYIYISSCDTASSQKYTQVWLDNMDKCGTPKILTTKKNEKDFTRVTFTPVRNFLSLLCPIVFSPFD